MLRRQRSHIVAIFQQENVNFKYASLFSFIFGLLSVDQRPRSSHFSVCGGEVELMDGGLSGIRNGNQAITTITGSFFGISGNMFDSELGDYFSGKKVKFENRFQR